MLTTQDIKTAVSRYWSGRAAGFDLQPSHAALNEAQHQAWLNLLREVAGPPPLTVLDVGCGTGFLAMRMAELGHTAVGIDLAEEMLAIAQSKAAGTGLPVTFRRGDAEAPPHDGAPYDVILERHVIWTLPRPGRQCAPGGSCSSLAACWSSSKAFLRCPIARSIQTLRPSCPSMVDAQGRNWQGCLRRKV